MLTGVTLGYLIKSGMFGKSNGILLLGWVPMRFIRSDLTFLRDT